MDLDVTLCAARPDTASPVLLRLQALGPCPRDVAEQVLAAYGRVEQFGAKSSLQPEHAPVGSPRYVLAGWACTYRLLPDGRRQLFDLILPGDGIGVSVRRTPVAAAGVATLTPVKLVHVGALTSPATLASSPALLQLLHAATDADERRILNHLVRLGRLTALERMANLLLEIRERLDIVGLVDGTIFPLPLTQEMLADLLGLSVVHVNRTLQELRRQGLAAVDRGVARLLDVAALARIASPAS